ncbi:MAG: protein kinase [Nanoarchaeota archaeon]|nr:protein kinase [Nanoarchaeota archaeon]
MKPDELGLSWKEYDDWSRDDRDLSGRNMIGKDNGNREKKFQIQEKIGEGEYGVVYKCLGENNETSAFKILKEGSAVELDSESRKVSKVNHPNVVEHKYYFPEAKIDGLKGTYSILVMEYVDGQTLKPEAGDSFCSDVVQVTEGLGAIHDAGYIHRDMKFDNIMRSKDGQIKITDFGFGKKVKTGELDASGDVSKSIKDGKIAGTPMFQPMDRDELMKPKADTDVYSLGSILNKMITGDVNAIIDAESKETLTKAAMERRLPNPEGLAKLVCGMTLKRDRRNPNSVESIKETAIYQEMEDIAGFPVYWRKLTEIIVQQCRYEDISLDTLAKLDKDKRIEGVAKLLKKPVRYRNYSRFLNKMSDFFGLQSGFKPKKEHPKNKEDAELEVQAIRYCLKNDEFTTIVPHLVEWEDRIKKYQSKFDINADEELGVLEGKIGERRERLFNDISEEIETRDDLDYLRRRVDRAKAEGLTREQARRLDLLVSNKLSSEEIQVRKEEAIVEKYYHLAESLNGKKVTQEFKDAFAMAAYKDGISAEQINWFLQDIERRRKKSLVERVKSRFSDSYIDCDKVRAEARAFQKEASDNHYSKKSVDEALKKINELGRKQNTFVTDYIENLVRVYPKFQEMHPHWSDDEFIRGDLKDQLEYITRLGHEYNINTRPVLDHIINNVAEVYLKQWLKGDGPHDVPTFRITANIEILKRNYSIPKESIQKTINILEKRTRPPFMDEKFMLKQLKEILNQNNQTDYKELQQKYPNAFKETSKFEDLEKIVGGKAKKEQKITKTSEKSKFKILDNKQGIDSAPYIVGGAFLGGIIPTIGAYLLAKLTGYDHPLEFVFPSMMAGTIFGSIAGLILGQKTTEKEQVSEPEPQKQPVQKEILPLENVVDTQKILSDQNINNDIQARQKIFNFIKGKGLKDPMLFDWGGDDLNSYRSLSERRELDPTLFNVGGGNFNSYRPLSERDFHIVIHENSGRMIDHSVVTEGKESYDCFTFRRGNKTKYIMKPILTEVETPENSESVFEQVKETEAIQTPTNQELEELKPEISEDTKKLNWKMAKMNVHEDKEKGIVIMSANLDFRESEETPEPAPELVKDSESDKLPTNLESAPVEVPVTEPIQTEPIQESYQETDEEEEDDEDKKEVMYE